jgi:hypothetical protein
MKGEFEIMSEHDFYRKAKRIVAEYVNRHLDVTDGAMDEYDVYVVWMCKTLQNNKALLSTTLFDGMYYEVTYNGDKNEAYLDAYKKFENRRVPVTLEGV